MLRKLWNWVLEVQQRRADYWLLNNMSDRQLKDIGMTRGEIKYRMYNDI